MKLARNPAIGLCVVLAAAIAMARAADGLARKAGDPAAQGEAARPAGEGVLCMLAISGVMAEAGRRCFPGRDPALQAELERSVARLEAFVLGNSEATREELQLFRQRQGAAGAPEAALCEGDIAAAYDDAAREGPDPVREATDRLVSRPGPPTWGDCL